MRLAIRFAVDPETILLGCPRDPRFESNSVLLFSASSTPNENWFWVPLEKWERRMEMVKWLNEKWVREGTPPCCFRGSPGCGGPLAAAVWVFVLSPGFGCVPTGSWRGLQSSLEIVGCHLWTFAHAFGSWSGQRERKPLSRALSDMARCGSGRQLGSSSILGASELVRNVFAAPCSP